MTGWNNWGAGTAVTAAEFVDTANHLLGAVLAQVPGEQARHDLLDGLASSLATSGRESVLAVETFEATGDDSRKEIARQARVIGADIAEIARQAPKPAGAVPLRSNCQGHLWTPTVAEHLTGSPNAAVVMQLYNEWLHQLVLLRDALLPYRNWQQARLRVDRQGLRRVEDARREFLAQFLTRTPRHDTIVRLAAAAVSDLPIPQRAYGFRVAAGTALPSVLTGPPLHSPRNLLDWAEGVDGAPTAFVPAVEDYLSLPTTTPMRSHRADRPEYTLVESGGRAGRSHLTLRSPGLPDVDLGQALRGHRYAYRVVGGQSAPPTAEIPRYAARDVLTADGLVDFPAGTHLIDSTADTHSVLAVLGKILPHNTILWDGHDWTHARRAGKAGPPRVVARSG